MANIKYELQVKRNGKYITESTEEDEKQVYCELAQDLINKKLIGNTGIISIKRVNRMDGFQVITVNYSNSYRKIYTVKAHI